MESDVQKELIASFFGAWKLVSAEFRLTGDHIVYPFGKEPQGLLLYGEHGYMSAQLMRPDRPTFASRDQLKGTPEEIKAAFEGFVSYYGAYEVDAEKGMVIHHVEGSLFPNWVGENLIRFFQFSGDRLTLTTPPIRVAGFDVVGVLIWERANRIK